jgi:hypothetical protein
LHSAIREQSEPFNRERMRAIKKPFRDGDLFHVKHAVARGLSRIKLFVSKLFTVKHPAAPTKLPAPRIGLIRPVKSMDDLPGSF